MVHEKYEKYLNKERKNSSSGEGKGFCKMKKTAAKIKGIYECFVLQAD